MVEVRYHDSTRVLQDLFAPDAHVQPPSPFDRPNHFALLEQAGIAPFIAVAQMGEASAALPLLQEAGRHSAMRNWYSFTWRPMLRGPDAASLIPAIAASLREHCHRVTMEPVPQEDTSAALLARAFAQAGWRVEVTECDTNHFIDVEGQSFEQYLAARPGALRTTLKRKAHKVHAQVLTHFDPAMWDAYEAIYASSWKPAEDYPAMLRSFAEQEAKAGRLRFGIALHDDTPVAVQFWTVEGGIAYIHKLAHLESARKLSAGTTLSAALFAHVIDRDHVCEVDFGTGDQAYKRDWMGSTRPRYRIDCFNMSRPKAWLELGIQTLRRLRESDIPMLAPFPSHG